MLLLFTFLLFILQLGDWYTTRTILNKGGKELNPVARKGIELLGMDTFLGLKVIFVTLLGFIGGYLTTPLAGGLLVVLYAYVVWHNYKNMS